MPARVPSFYDFEELVDNVLGNVMEQCPESRIETWKHQAHQYVIDNCVDIGIIKMAFESMDGGDWALGSFVFFCEYFGSYLTLQKIKPEPVFEEAPE